MENDPSEPRFRWNPDGPFGDPQSHGEYPHWPQSTQPFVWTKAAPHSGHCRHAGRGSASPSVAVSEAESRMVVKHHRDTMASHA